MESETEQPQQVRLRWTRYLALALIASPVFMLFILLAVQNLDPGTFEDWLLLIAFLWFLFVDMVIDPIAKRSGLRERLKRLGNWIDVDLALKTLTFAPILAVCFIEPGSSVIESTQQWLFGFAACCVVFPVSSILFDYVGAQLKRFLASRRDKPPKAG